MGKGVVLEVAEVREGIGHGQGCRPSQDNAPCQKGKKRLAIEDNTKTTVLPKQVWLSG